MTVVLNDTVIRLTIGKLRAVAGVDAEAGALAEYLESSLSRTLEPRRSPEQFAAELRELTRIHDEVAPSNRLSLSDYAVSRAGIYEDDEARD